MIKIAINGFGRIGRLILRAIHENGYSDCIEVVAINDLGATDINAHLLQFDSAHGRFRQTIEYTDESISIDGVRIAAYQQRDPSTLPWRELDVDIVFECTGHFRDRESASLHLQAGAKKVLLSAPGKQFDATIVYGVNEHIIKASDRLVSNASCTTNCLALVAKALNDSVGIVHGIANTIHSMTNTQNVVDAYHKDKRRSRAASHSMIPTSTGSANAIGLVIPELAGKLNAVAVRVPTINVSLLDFTFTPEKRINLADLQSVFQEYLKGKEQVFGINTLPLVSIDFNHDSRSCVVDMAHTRINGGLVKVLAWYDNEWGFSNRMLDTAFAMGALSD
ncbi:MAG: glyceraldehyde 3-phosphate dehydrogenase [Candidatus Azotimanducaceae bacterium]|jgi:glyceraldehyde 3-phosphate dehydrogenase